MGRTDLQWPPFLSNDDIQRILQLREAAKHISITVHIWESVDPIDFIGRSMDTYYCHGEA